MQQTVEVTIAELVKELAERFYTLATNDRFIVGIAGIPGAGKSTIAELLVRGINKIVRSPEAAVLVPMDGYHLSNETLRDRGIVQLKGIPDSFDAYGFVELIKEIRTDIQSLIPAPLFDRSTEASVDGAIVIKPENKICVVEGNYLLLPQPPWDRLRQYFDQVWFLDATIEDVHPRLLERHLLARTPQETKIKIESTDIPNANLILQTKKFADRVIRIEDLKNSPSNDQQT